MRTTFLLFATLGILSTAMAQHKTTGTITLGTMSIKIDLNQTTSLVTLTMTGPSTRWLSVGFNATSMTSNTDCFTYGTSLLDQSLPGGHNAATTDATNNLTLVSNTVVGTTRTVVATRPFNTSDANDFTFSYTMSNLNLIWAIGPSTNVNSQHSNFGSTSLSFTLGVEDFASLDNLKVYPNPSEGIFMVFNANRCPISKIKVFDANAKLVKEVTSELESQNSSLNLSEMTKGIYFLEISNDNDKTIRKIIKN